MPKLIPALFIINNIVATIISQLMDFQVSHSIGLGAETPLISSLFIIINRVEKSPFSRPLFTRFYSSSSLCPNPFCKSKPASSLSSLTLPNSGPILLQLYYLLPMTLTQERIKTPPKIDFSFGQLELVIGAVMTGFYLFI